MGKLAGIVGLLLSVLALAGAFENFSNVGFVWKLAVTGLAGMVVLFLLAHWFGSRLKSAPRAGFIRSKPGGRSGLFIASAIVLAIVCGVFVALAIAEMNWFTLRVDQSETAQESITTVIAPSTRIARVEIPLPANSDSTCSWKDITPASLPALSATMVDFDSATPNLDVAEFVYPQRIEIRCNPPRTLRQFVLTPQTVAIYEEARLSLWRFWAVIIGGVTWLLACGGLWYWSR